MSVRTAEWVTNQPCFLCSMVSGCHEGNGRTMSSSFKHSAIEYCRALLSWRSSIVYLLCLLGWILYQCTDLRPLQVFLAATVAKTLERGGYFAFAWGTDLCVHGYWTVIGKECTFMDLFFMTAPLVIRGRAVLWDCLRLCVYFLTLFSLNLARIVLSKVLHVAGVPRTINHDLIAYCLWYGILIIMLFSWLRVKVVDARKVKAAENEE